MTTFEMLQGRIRRMVNDTEGIVYSFDYLMDAMNDALDAILPWQPKLGISTITGDGTTTTFSLPSLCYDIDAIVVRTSGESIGRFVFAPGSFFSSMTTTKNLWTYSPANQVTFANPITSGEIYDIHYLQPWTKITDSSMLPNAIDAPEWTVPALAIYAVSKLLVSASLDTSNLAQYKTRIDSGDPEDNPLQKSITYLLKLFTQEMNRHPRYQRSQV